MSKKNELQKRVDYLEGLLQEEADQRQAEVARFAELEPYELRNARSTYVSGEDPYLVATALLAEASQVDFAAGSSPTSIILTVQYVPEGAALVLGNPTEPAYFSGQVTTES